MCLRLPLYDAAPPQLSQASCTAGESVHVSGLLVNPQRSVFLLPAAALVFKEPPRTLVPANGGSCFHILGSGCQAMGRRSINMLLERFLLPLEKKARHKPPGPGRPEAAERRKLPGSWQNCSGPSTSERGGRRRPGTHNTHAKICIRGEDVEDFSHVFRSLKSQVPLEHVTGSAHVPPAGPCWAGRRTGPAGCAGPGCRCRTVQLWSGSPPVPSQQGRRQTIRGGAISMCLISIISAASSAESANWPGLLGALN